MVKEPTVISTFAGTGGSSLGYKWAGYKELLAIDWEQHAVECFKANFPEVPIWHKDITKVASQEILEFCNLKVGELDVFDGSPPCQGFSTAGRREVSDPRNDLFQHYWRLVKELQPKVFVMENVSGMVKGTMKGKFIEIMNTLKSDNYIVKCKLMNAMYYGVPQSRQRTIFIGVRKDLNKEPVYPKPSNKVIKVKEAIGFLEESEKANRKEITPCFLEIAKKLKVGESGSKYHPKGSFFGLIRVHPNYPCNTIIKSAGSGLLHYKDNLKFLSVNELKVLCSFPIDWKLGNSRSDAIGRLGNAVMPKFMQHIALCIKDQILS